MIHPPSLFRGAVAVFVAMVAVLVPGRVQAHTEFDFSFPADGDTVGAPLSEITVAFTLPVTLVGGGFEVLEPGGNIVQPSVSTADDREFLLTVDPGMSGGAVGVRYEVRAEDGHVLADGFSFTVAAAPATTVPATTEPAATTVPAVTATAVPTTAAPDSATTPATPADTAAATEAAPTEAGESAAATTDDAPLVDPADEAGESGDDDGGGPGAGLWIVLGAVALAVGAAFLAMRARFAA